MDNKKKKKRWRILGVLIVAIAVFCLFLFSSNKIDVEHIDIYAQNLPVEMDGFRIVHLSDLHLPSNNSRVETVLQLVAEQSPDMIVMTGDMINSTADISKTRLQEFCEGLVQIADVVAVSGNHELWNEGEWKRVMKDSGVQFIDGMYVVRDGITFIGVGYGRRLKRTPPDFTILLSHNPIDADADVIFSGHAHGGLWRIPFIGGVIAPDQGFFPRYTSGLYEFPNGSRLVMSRGLGDRLISLRLNNRPHLPVVTLRINKK